MATASPTPRVRLFKGSKLTETAKDNLEASLDEWQPKRPKLAFQRIRSIDFREQRACTLRRPRAGSVAPEPLLSLAEVQVLNPRRRT